MGPKKFPDDEPPESEESAGEDAAPAADPSAERRRLARVVHDDRGTASVEWQEVPPDFVGERPKLEVESYDDTVRRIAILNEGAEEPFNPYNQQAKPRRPKAPAPRKRDLRKLSEWIKMMRGRGDRPEDDEDEGSGV